MFYFLVCFYIFCVLIVVCDDYFVVLLNWIIKCLGFKLDVVGVIFMVVGSFVLIFFILIILIFFIEGDIGFGIIVGLIIFNIFFIIVLCGIGVGLMMCLKWYLFFRDFIMYVISVIILMILIYDWKIYWYESVVFFILYFVYIIVMYFNLNIEEWFMKLKDWIIKFNFEVDFEVDEKG